MEGTGTVYKPNAGSECGAYVEGNVAVPAVYLADSETGVSSHGSVDHTVSQQCAVNIIRCIARDGAYHVCRICRRHGCLKLSTDLLSNRES
jgi:hypothetical protein